MFNLCTLARKHKGTNVHASTYAWNILIVAQGGYGGYTLRDKLRSIVPNAKVQVLSRHVLKSVDDHDICIVAGYGDVLGRDPIAGSFLIYGDDSKRFLSVVNGIKGAGKYKLCQRESILKLMAT